MAYQQSNAPLFSYSNSASKTGVGNEQSLQQSYTIRIVTCGQPLVGKTSLLKRLTKKSFNPNEPSTIGSEYIHFDYSNPEGNQKLHLQIWDTAGEEKYRSLAPLYFRNSNGALLVYDQTSRNTFDSLNDWVEIYKDSNGDDALFFVIANKSDLVEEESHTRKVQFNFTQTGNINDNRKNSLNQDSFLDEAFNWAQSRGYPFFETSAKTGECIENLISSIDKSFIEKMENAHKKHFCRNKFISLNNDKDQGKCSC